MESKHIIENIVKQGGRVLIVGGGVSKLPLSYQEHSKLLIWDDEIEGIQNRVIPSTVKVIMWNRNISHATTAKLNNAVAGLRAFKFPMLKMREIKELLSCIIPVEFDEHITVNDRPIHTEFIPLTPTVTPVVKPEIKETVVVKRQVLSGGVLKKFIAKNLNLDIDYTKRGSISKEGERLFVLATNEGIKTTVGSVNQAIGAMLKELTKSKTEIKANKAEISAKKEITGSKLTGDDFDELDKLLVDAVAAMKLIQEHMPKIKKEVEKLRSIRAKMFDLLS